VGSGQGNAIMQKRGLVPQCEHQDENDSFSHSIKRNTPFLACEALCQPQSEPVRTLTISPMLVVPTDKSYRAGRLR